jgi:threonine synthase
MIEYVSTRDTDEQCCSYTDALLQGLAPDGGLFVPTEYPYFDTFMLRELANKPYVDVFTAIKSAFVGDSIDIETQTRLATAAFTINKFPDARNGNITPVQGLGDGISIEQLSLGPTAAFKDMALQPLGQDMQHVLAKGGENLVLLGATSGDTGASAAAAVKGLGNIVLFMLSPEEGMSYFQKAQTGQLSGGNIHNISIRGAFDDCQDIVKEIKADPEFANLGAVNSINWGRIASQIPYYVAGYLQAVNGDVGRMVDFVVPTGNFGNILAGYYARQIGVPIRRLIAATNENNVVDRLIQTGQYVRPPHAITTTSPSMDITVASNYERLVYELFGEDPERTRAYMQRFKDTGSVSFKEFGLPNSVLIDNGFDSGRSNYRDRLDSIKWAAREATNKMVIDPHTADGVTVAKKKKIDTVPTICMSTALAVKFEETIALAIGEENVPKRPARFENIESGSKGGFTVLDADPTAVKTYIRQALGHAATV